jgi:hypothetical protein
MSTSNSNTTLLDGDNKLVAGLQQNEANLPALMILGTTYTAAQALAVLQSRIAKETATTTSKAAWAAAIQAQKDEMAATKAFVSALKTQLHVWFANNPEMLATYGLVPKKQSGPKTAVTKVLAAAKGAKTREARHTMGPVARKAVKGLIPATITIEAPAGSTQVASVASAPVGAAGQGASAGSGVSAPVASSGPLPHSPNGAP